MSAPASSPLTSERRLAANRANAQRSTGPCTKEGKAKSSLNAVKTGLTGRTVLLPSEDAEAYDAHLARYQQEFQPAGVLETQLVQNLADTQWRLDRIANLEAGIFALGRLQYDELFKGQEARHLLDAHILMTEAKHFKNLHLQESRLRRRYQQDAQELKELQAERKKEQEAKKEEGAKGAAKPTNGFEFTDPAKPGRDREGANRPSTDLVHSGAESAPAQTAVANMSSTAS